VGFNSPDSLSGVHGIGGGLGGIGGGVGKIGGGVGGIGGVYKRGGCSVVEH
jgi:hypothetical protein